jgi:peptidoglycan L-alanyl-D-glutamate endopeptidase CwlK
MQFSMCKMFYTEKAEKIKEIAAKVASKNQKGVDRITISKEDFTVIEGLRTMERQRKLLAQGFTKTLNSRHLTGHAVDICPYPIDWNDHQRFTTVSQAMKEAAQKLNVPIVWGGDWKNGWDKPHYELTRQVYPA